MILRTRRRNSSPWSLDGLKDDVRRVSCITFLLALVIFFASAFLSNAVLNVWFWKPISYGQIERAVLEREALARIFLTSDIHSQERAKAKLIDFRKLSKPSKSNRTGIDLDDFIEELNVKERQLFFKTFKTPTIPLCVAVQSSFRTEPYVLRTIASLLHAQSQNGSPSVLAAVIDLGQSEEVKSIIQNAHSNIHILSRDQLLASVAPNALKVQYEKVRNMSGWLKGKEAWIAIQRLDYALALVYCDSNSCDRCLVLENDALLSADATRRAIDASAWLDDHHTEWGLLRLFRSDFFDGWENVERDIQIVALFIGFGGIVGFGYAVCVQRNPLVWAICGAAWAAAVCFLIGKQHLPILGTSRAEGIVEARRDGSVSSIAHVYPWHVVSFLIDQLGKPCCQGFRRPIDLYIGDTLGLQGATFWELIPNAAEHIGVRSSYQGAESKGIGKGWHTKFIQSATFDISSTPY